MSEQTIHSDFDTWLNNHVQGIKDFIKTVKYTDRQRDMFHAYSPEQVNDHILTTAQKILDKWNEYKKESA